MRIDIVNGSVVTGDGKSVLEKTSVISEDGFISESSWRFSIFLITPTQTG